MMAVALSILGRRVTLGSVLTPWARRRVVRAVVRLERHGRIFGDGLNFP
jgi:hypothetical protein